MEIYMTDIESYLKANPELAAESGRDLQSTDSLVLNVVVLGISAKEIVFAHLGQEFSVSREDVLDVSETHENVFNPFPRGKAAKLVLKEEATLRRQGAIKAAQLQRNLPLPLALPTSIPNRPLISSREVEWRAQHGYQAPAEQSSPHVGETDSPTACQTNGGWHRDDFGYDDLITVMGPW
jgi:hypothetical protein